MLYTGKLCPIVGELASSSLMEGTDCIIMYDCTDLLLCSLNSSLENLRFDQDVAT